MKLIFFLLFFIPSLALSNPFMGDCKSQYEATYKLMMARQPKPLAQQGEHKSSLAMQINMQRTSEVYQHGFVTPKGIGNYHHNEDYSWTN